MLNISVCHKEQRTILANIGFHFMQIPFRVDFSVFIYKTIKIY